VPLLNPQVILMTKGRKKQVSGFQKKRQSKATPFAGPALKKLGTTGLRKKKKKKKKTKRKKTKAPDVIRCSRRGTVSLVQ